MIDETEIRQRFLAIDTSNVGDVLDKMGLREQGLAPDFAPFPADAGRLAGFAYTIRGQMAPYDETGDALKMQACSGISANQVSVWSGDGDGICYFGELIALGMQERGCTGALVDGGVRDVRWLGVHKFPTYARYRTPIQSIHRWRVTAWQEPVYLRGATSTYVKIAPGDFILGDEDGVIAIPRDHIQDVLIESEALTAKEVAIRAELRQGLTLQEALKKFGHV